MKLFSSFLALSSAEICREKHCFFDLELTYRFTMSCQPDGQGEKLQECILFFENLVLKNFCNTWTSLYSLDFEDGLCQLCKTVRFSGKYSVSVVFLVMLSQKLWLKTAISCLFLTILLGKYDYFLYLLVIVNYFSETEPWSEYLDINFSC